MDIEPAAATRRSAVFRPGQQETPAFELARARNRRIRRTRRRQVELRDARAQAGIEPRQDVAAERLLGSAAVQRDRPDGRMRGEQSRNVVRDFAVANDGTVQAAAALTAFEHIPDADAAALQARNALRVHQLRSGIEQFAHERPEQVVLVAVGLAQLERAHARHRAEDQHHAVRRYLGRETLYLVVAWSLHCNCVLKYYVYYESNVAISGEAD